MLLLIQLISIYRFVVMLIFMMFYTVLPNEINTLLLLTAIASDQLDGYLAKTFNLTTLGGAMLDLFSDKYLSCICIIFLVSNHYPLFPLLIILAKEIFVLGFRSIKIEGRFVISTNRTIGGIMSIILLLAVFLHINHVNASAISTIVIALGIMNFIYLIYKIVSNFKDLKAVFDIGNKQAKFD